MSKNRTWFHTTINNIDFKMIRKNSQCWIKIAPLIRVSNPSSIHLKLNNENYGWEIYDKEGRETHLIYFEGFNITPNFYLKSGKNCYKINCDTDGIKVIPITEKHSQDRYISKNCHCISSQTNCWAKAVYYTSRPDKPPFDEM